MACAASMSIRTSTSSSSATTVASTVTSLSKRCLGSQHTISRRAIGTSPPAQILAKALRHQGACHVAERRPPECDRTAPAKPKPSTKIISRRQGSHQIWADLGQRDKRPIPRLRSPLPEPNLCPQCWFLHGRRTFMTPRVHPDQDRYDRRVCGACRHIEDREA